MSVKMELPKRGKTSIEVLECLRKIRKDDADWKNGRTWSLVYYGGEEIDAILKEAYTMFFSENGLGQRAFPSLRKLETEVVQMTANLLGGDTEATGTMTSGGTESIVMALKTYRDKFRVERPDITEPEIIIPTSAHPAFHKACHFLDLTPVMVGLKHDFRVNIEDVREAITKNTILIVGSAPGYPHGVIDPIEDLAVLALEHHIGCHVDACLGGYFLPFLRKLGYNIPKFDFSVPGVTSISADLHKYGFAAKGASTILYRDRALRKYQFHVYSEWIGGIYASPALAGTRPGGSFAAAWAIMNYLGEEGYKKIIQKIMNTTKILIDNIESIPGMYILGEPEMSVFAFTIDALNVFRVGEEMSKRGWYISRQHNPNALHVMVTLTHEGIVDQFIDDLRDCVKIVSKEKQEDTSNQVAMYGDSGSLTNSDDLNQHVLNELDKLLTFGSQNN